jgi:hypothetical protein
VQDDGPVGLDGVQVSFDDERVVSDAGVALAATLAARLGIEALADRFVRLRRDRPGAGNAGRKVMALVFAMALGADSIDDCEVLRAGRTRRLLGGWLPAPSTLGTFLRAFTFGHVRQLDRLLGECLTRAWAAGAGPGEGRLTVDVDSFVGEVHGYAKREGFEALLVGRSLRLSGSRWGALRERAQRRRGLLACASDKLRHTSAEPVQADRAINDTVGHHAGVRWRAAASGQRR